MEAAVIRLRRNRAGVHTHLRSEHLQAWIRESYLAENSNTPPQPNLMD